MKFDYLLDKVADAPFQREPFTHLYISNFLEPADFAAIVGSPAIQLGQVNSTPELFEKLAGAGYKVISFPGCVTSEKQYLDWEEGRSARKVHAATEAFGIVYRLDNRRDDTLAALEEFFASDALRDALLQKFGITGNVTLDGGIQKYLNGYEISPHCDIRRKALTWMLNLNPGEAAEQHDYHTHYLKMKPEWQFVQSFWRGNPQVDRDWMPWDWCETVMRQRDNNSIVFFSPSDDTVHAVKADYDHRQSQRTQLYGNLWYDDKPLRKMEYREFEALKNGAAAPKSMMKVLKQSAVGDVVRAAKSLTKRREEFENIRKVDVGSGDRFGHD